MRAPTARWAAWVGPAVVLGTVLSLLPPPPRAAVAASDVVITWASRQPMPTARFFLAAVTATNGKIYAIGGSLDPGASLEDATRVQRTVEEYDPATNTWATKAPMPTPRYVLAAAAAPNGKIYAIGGLGPGNTQTAIVEEYDPGTNSWSRKADLPVPKYGAGAAVGSNGKVYVIGGLANTGGGTVSFSTVDAYDPVTNAWTPRAAMPTARGVVAVVAATNGRIYAIGGRNPGTGLATTEEYDPAANAWRGRASMPGALDSPAGAAAPNGRVYVFQGHSFEYDPPSDTWASQTPAPISRDRAAAAAAAGKIYVLGGGAGSGPLALVEQGTLTPINRAPTANPGGRYSVTWASRQPMPTARFGLAVVTATNGKIYAIGGNLDPGASLQEATRVQRTVEEYDPATNTWATKAPMPTERYALAAAAAPNGKIYAIGGLGPGNTQTAVVEEYDPSTDSWARKADLPVAKYELGAVVGPNGKVYAIGGFSNTGAVTFSAVDEYDPAGNTWTSRAAVPTARGGLAVVAATNGRIYAIGGKTFFGGGLATAEEYDPAANVWGARASMPGGLDIPEGAAAPNGRVYVFQGSNVFEYDPPSDTWARQTDLPTSRDSLGAAAAAGKLYAIGGRGGTGPSPVVEEGTLTGGAYSVPEGSSAVLIGSGTDLDGDPLTFAWDLDNNGTFETPGQTATFSAAGRDGPSTQTVVLRVCDNHGACTPAATTVSITNVAPTGNLTNSGPVNEGASVTASFGNQFDPSSADTAAGFHYAFACDNASLAGATHAVSGSGASANCSFRDNGTFPVRARIIDKDDGFSEYQTSVVVNNVAPSVGPITAPTAPVQVGTSISASAPFTDPGVLDTHTALWSWGDGSTSSGVVTEINGSGSVSGTHLYTAAGVYTINLTVTDKDGGAGGSAFQFVVVYDPDGGFVTGSGWINSPSGACQLTTACENATGRATFGFVSKYQPGATVPEGRTEFLFHAGDLRFRSTAYDWLVVAGARGQFKGIGTINSAGTYGFMLTAVDGEVSGGGGVDRFRVKIWDISQSVDGSTGIVYDNQMGAANDADPSTRLGGGAIVIQK